MLTFIPQVNLPFIGIALPFVYFFLRLHFRATKLREKMRRVDWVGSVLFVGSSTSFLIPITWGGVSYSWSSWRTLVPLLLGTAGLIAFVPYEAFVAKEPLIRLQIFSQRTATLAFFQTFFHGMILWCLLYYEPLYFEAVKDQSPIQAGLSLFPQTFTVAPVAVITGFIITKTGRYRWAIRAGWCLTTLGMGILYLMDVHTPTVQWVFMNLVCGLGMGLLFSSTAYAAQAAQRNEDTAFAVSMFSFFRCFGQAVGVAVGGTIFQNQIRRELQAYPQLAPLAEQYSSDAASLVQVIRAMEGEELEQRAQLVQAYADALKIVWVTMCGLAGLALISSFFVKGLDINVPLETEQGFKEKKREAEGNAVKSR